MRKRNLYIVRKTNLYLVMENLALSGIIYFLYLSLHIRYQFSAMDLRLHFNTRNSELIEMNMALEVNKTR